MGWLAEERAKNRQEQQPLNTELAGSKGFLQQLRGSPVGKFTQAQAPVNRSLYDVTIGAAEYGASEFGGNLAAGIDRSFISSDALVSFAKTQRKFMQDHPEYSPVQVDSASELISNPMALSSRVFAGGAQLAAQMGALAVPYAGIPLAAGLSYTVSAQQGYESALRDGASQEQAEANGFRSGLIHAAVDTLQAQRIVKFTSGEAGWFASKVASKVEKMTKAGKLTADLIGEATMAATYSSLMGAADEGIANITYGKKIEEGFFDRRLQDAVGGAAAAAVFGVTGKGIRGLVQKKTDAKGKEIEVPLNVFDKESFYDFLHKEKSMEKPAAKALAETTDAFARNWAERNGENVEAFYGTYVQQDNLVKGSVGEHIANDVAQVPKIFLSNDPTKVLSDLTLVMSSQMSLADKALFTKHLGETIAAAAMRDPKTGKIATGNTHAEAFNELLKTVPGLNPKEMFGIGNEGEHDGFVTNTGRYVTRTEASQIAKADRPQLGSDDVKYLHDPENNPASPSLNNKISEALFEYLKSGKAPSGELIPAFESMKQLFKDVYLTTKEAAFEFNKPVSDGTKSVLPKENSPVADFVKDNNLVAHGTDELENISGILTEGMRKSHLGAQGLEYPYILLYSRDQVKGQEKNYRPGEFVGKAKGKPVALLFEPEEFVLKRSPDDIQAEMTKRLKEIGQDPEKPDWDKALDDPEVKKLSTEFGHVLDDLDTHEQMGTKPKYESYDDMFAEAKAVADKHGIPIYRVALDDVTAEKHFTKVVKAEPKPITNLPIELTGALDRLLSIDTDQIVEARAKLGEAVELKQSMVTGTGKVPERILAIQTPDGRVFANPRGATHADVLPLLKGQYIQDELTSGWKMSLNGKEKFYSDEQIQTFKTKAEFDAQVQKDIGGDPTKPTTELVSDGMSVAEVTKPAKTEVQDAIIKDLELDLQKLQIGRTNPNSPSAVERRAAAGGTNREVIRHEDVGDTVIRKGYQHALDSATYIVDMFDHFRRFKSGTKAKQGADDIVAQRKFIEGQYEQPITEAFQKLSRADKAWLNQIDETEATKTGVRLHNFVRMVDLAAVGNPLKPPTPSLQAFLDLAKRINNELGSINQREGGTIKLPDGSSIPYNQPDELRMIRSVTDDVRNAIERGSGEIWDALVADVTKNNKGMKLSSVRASLLNHAQGVGLKRSGPLTEARRITTMSSEIITKTGKKIQTYHIEPLEFLRRNVRIQAYQIGLNRVFGQAELKGVKGGMIRQLARDLGVAPVVDAEYVKKAFAAKGQEFNPELAEALTKNFDGIRPQLLSIAKDAGVSLAPKRQEFVDALLRMTPADLTPKAAVVLKHHAKTLNGIDPNLHPVELLREVQHRILEKPGDNLAMLRDNFIKENPSETAGVEFDQMFALSQGIPVFHTTSTGQYLERNRLYRGVKFVSGIIGAVQTSTSVIPNLLQTMVQVPQMVGIKNFLGAVESAVKDYKNTRSAQITMGAFGDSLHAWGLERGYWLEGISRNIRQAVQTGTGMRFISDFNNVVAGEAFRRTASDWKKGNFSESDAKLAKSLRLNDAEIAGIRKGEMSELTFAKIVQNGVAKTQFVTESAHNRGYLENHPVMSLIFAYNSYASGTLRQTIDFARTTKALIASGDPKQMAHAGVKIVTLLGGSLGAGMVSEVLRNVIRGDVSKEQKDTNWDRVWAGLFSVQLMGPTQRILDAGKYDQGSIDRWTTGMMPQVRAVQDGLAVIYNALSEKQYGKHGKFPLEDQAMATFLQHTPVAKAVKTWMDNVAYPELGQYREVKANTGKFFEKVIKKEKNVGETKLNPEYNDVFNWIIRGDEKMAVKAAMEYYDKYRAEGLKMMNDDPEQAQFKQMSIEKAISGLRGSLTARSPISISPEKMGLYLKTLPEDKREKYLAVHARYMSIVNTVAPSKE